ncbi:MAG: hypothetical protein DRN92_08480 [Thermoproteota archaeon]|nr:MAG: hypothetical protein DRN92_08480 [Candidatus Korarchaeota archaeon]
MLDAGCGGGDFLAIAKQGSCALNRGRAKGGTPKRLLDPNSGPLGGNPRLPYRKQEVERDNLSAPRLNVDLPQTKRLEGNGTRA